MTKLEETNAAPPAVARTRNRTRKKAPRGGAKIPAGEAVGSDRLPAAVLLGPLLTIREAMSLKQQFRALFERGRAVDLDGGAVSSADTAGIQLLVALAIEANRRQVEIAWRGASPVLLQSAARLGFSALLGLPTPDENLQAGA